MHSFEKKRDKLLADDNALTELLEQHPHLDAQHLRTLIRNARKEQAESKPPKAYREIFQILKQLHAESKKPGEDIELDEEEDESGSY
jgi:ribosome-associated protein